MSGHLAAPDYLQPLSECDGTPGCLGGIVSVTLTTSSAIDTISSGSIGAPGVGFAYRVIGIHASGDPANTGVVRVFSDVDAIYSICVPPPGKGGAGEQFVIPPPGFLLPANTQITFKYTSHVASQKVTIVFNLLAEHVS